MGQNSNKLQSQKMRRIHMHKKQGFCVWVAGALDRIFQTQGGHTSWRVCDCYVIRCISCLY